MSEYQLSNLHLVIPEVTGAARSVWWGAQCLKGSLNAACRGKRLSGPRGLMHLSFVKLVSDFYHTYSPPTLYLFFKIHKAHQDGDIECQKASLRRYSIHLMFMLIVSPSHPFQICKRSEMLLTQC